MNCFICVWDVMGTARLVATCSTSSRPHERDAGLFLPGRKKTGSTPILLCPGEDSSLTGTVHVSRLTSPTSARCDMLNIFSSSRKRRRSLSSWAQKNRLYADFIVPRRGLEPPRIAPLVPKTSAYTNSATWALT